MLGSSNKQQETTVHRARCFRPKPANLAMAEKWEEYVKGNCRRPMEDKVDHPKRGAKTVISESRSEPSANKPLIYGKCEGQDTKILLDTGAEMNVIDGALFRQLAQSNKKISLNRNSANIVCANGTKIKSLGTTFLRLNIGNCQSDQKFTIVESIFPKVIVGLRSMKSMDVYVDALNDCAVVWGQFKVPFVSKTVAASIWSGKETRTAL
jgi:hypothetical protein